MVHREVPTEVGGFYRWEVPPSGGPVCAALQGEGAWALPTAATMGMGQKALNLRQVS